MATQGRRAAASATARPAGGRQPQAPTATPLPLLPFWQAFRSQVARLEGVRELPVPSNLATAQAAAPPVGLRCGACHSDRLRHGHFLYVNAGPPRRGGRRGSLSLLQGALFPSLFSFHPPLAFQAAAFEGGEGWAVWLDYLPLPEAAQAVLLQEEAGDAHGQRDVQQQQQQQQTQQQQQQQQQGPQRGAQPGGSDAPATPEGWQARQLARLAALRELHAAAAVPLPRSLPAVPPAARPSPAAVLLSSAQLAVERGKAGAAARRAALEREALPAFHAALALHLNALAAAPADACREHVARMAAAQAAAAAALGAQQLLCGPQLAAALGDEWLQELQEHLAASPAQGLAEAAAAAGALGGGDTGVARRGERQASTEFVYLDPSQPLRSQDEP